MKKILLATTMLASVAGYAAADVAVSGDARMGVVSTEGNSIFESRMRIKFSGTGTTDGGLAFGGSFRAADANGANDGTKGSVFISGAFGKISMGDVDSGDEAAVGQLSSVGYEGLGSTNSISYAADGGAVGLTDSWIEVGNGEGAKVLYTYSAGALTLNASSGQLTNNEYYSSQSYGVGAAYTTGALTLAVGYGSNELTGYINYDGGYEGSVSLTDISASVAYVMGDTTVKAIYQDKEAEISYDNWTGNLGDAVSMGASVDHKMDALTLTAFAITTEFSSDFENFDVSLNRYGVGASYDLGGGASFKAGWAEVEALSNDYEVASQSAFDAGVNFSF